MERQRLLLFIALAGLIFITHSLLMKRFNPPQPPARAAVKEPRKHDKKAADKKAGDEKDKADEKAGEGKEGEKAAKPKPPLDEQPETALPAQRLSLGSYQAKSGYRLLVTLNNEGAAVERVELTSHQYRDLEDRSGYLGHLAPADAPNGGCLVQVVGRGTPADLAGLKAGDVIVHFGEQQIARATDLVEALRASRAEQTIAIGLTRGEEKLELKATLDRRPLEIIRPETKGPDGKPVPAEVADGVHDPLSLLVSLAQIDGDRLRWNEDEELPGAKLREATWEVVEGDEDHAVFRRKLSALGIEVTKRYRLAKAPADGDVPDAPEYHLFLDVELKNLSTEKMSLAYRLEGPTGLPLEGAWYASKLSRDWGMAGMRDVIARFPGQDPTQISCTEIVDLKEDEKKKRWHSNTVPLDYIAVDAQYFSAAVVPQKADPTDVWFDDIEPVKVGAVPPEKTDRKLTDVSFRLTSKEFSLAPEETFHHEYQLFAGPKKPAILDQYQANGTTLEGLIYYGWFGFVAKPMQGILHMFYFVVRNYGLAIVMLTLLVRGCMFPLSRRQTQSSQKMAELKPEMARIQEKYKDPAQRSKALQDLYRKHNFNPFGGCLLMFVQLPIFVGLYRSLMVDVELRQAPLISDSVRWCSNLAAPDMLWDWTAMMPTFIQGYLGPYLNVLPFLTIGLMMWQQKAMMPPPTDEQTAMQQKMMSYMSIFFGFMFYKWASGLGIYFIASSLWSVAERKILPKAGATPAGGSSGGGGGGAGPRRGSDGGNGSPSGKRRQSGRK